MHIAASLCRGIVLACAAATLPAVAGVPEDGWTVRVASGPVVFKGFPLEGAEGAAGTMMYPAPNVAGLLVGILAHGLVASSVQDTARKEREQAADKVLEPLRPGLAGFTEKELAESALAGSLWTPIRLAVKDDVVTGKLVEMAPVFRMTQERDALVLEHSIAVTREDGHAYRNMILVISQARHGDDLLAYWKADDARHLKSESIALLSISLDIALEHVKALAPAAAPARYRTVRYRLGEKELYERAEVLKEHCGRALLRNLRGWFMSVPLSKPSGEPGNDCPATLR